MVWGGIHCCSCHGGDASLEGVLRSKQRALESQLASLRPQQLQSRLLSVSPSPTPNALLRAIRQRSSTTSKDVAMVAEVTRGSDSADALAHLCNDYARWGVDAIAVRTDESSSPDGLADLAIVSNNINIPVIRADWILHPLQVAETREAGGAALPIVFSIVKKGLPGLFSYATSLCLDPIVEIVNLQELEAVSQLGATLYGINLSVGVSLPVPGLRQDIAKSLLQLLHPKSQTIVGIRSVEEALEMKKAGASAVYFQHEVFQQVIAGELEKETCVRRLRRVLSEG